jgi:serine/threonine-protein kinase
VPDPERRGGEAFRQESCILSALPGDHIVRVEEFIDDDRIPLLVVQRLAGTPMEECLDRPRAVGLRWFLDFLRGLRTVHDFGVVHRDLKPENVIVLPSQRAPVIDFGVAAIGDPRRDRGNSRRRRGRFVGIVARRAVLRGGESRVPWLSRSA